MRHKDWEILKVGDAITRVKWESAEHVALRDNKPLQSRADLPVRTNLDVFQVIQIQSGRVTAVRLLSALHVPGMRMSQTEVVEFDVNSATAEDPTTCESGTLVYTWVWNNVAGGQTRLTGGFTVTRANGAVEYERCPTDTTRS